MTGVIPLGMKIFVVSVILSFTVLNIIQANMGQPRWKPREKKPESTDEITHHPFSSPRKNIYSLTSIEDRLAYNFPYRENDAVENNIFQLWKTNEVSGEVEELMNRWRDANEDHDYVFLTLKEAETLVVDFLRPTVPEIVDALRLLPNDRLKFEYLKFILIYLQGGVYSDVDTIDIKPIKFWFENNMLKTKFWVGIDSDYNDPKWFEHYLRRITFNTNIFRAKSHHPLLRRVIARIAFIAFTQKDTINSIDWDEQYKQVDANGSPLIQFTGQLLFTDAVFEYMNELEDQPYFTSMDFKKTIKGDNILSNKIYGPHVDSNQKFSYKKFTQLYQPVQVYDLCVLPHVSFNGFESALRDVFDDDNSKLGLDKSYYARGKSLTEWSPQKVKLDSN